MNTYPIAAYSDQIQRIKKKILEAKDADKNYIAFGADQHKYQLNKPATAEKITEIENKYSIELPDCYKSFVLTVGNGGIGWQDSSAGPFFGIYPLGENMNELIDVDAEKYLKNRCVIHPKMTNEFWEALSQKINGDETMTDEEYDHERGNLWAGILPVGSQGCSYLHGVVLNGPYRGRVVNLDIDGQKPNFAFEKNFLDWYERWLDEVISGELIDGGTGWFGYQMGGTEEELLTIFTSSTDLAEKDDCLNGLLNKKKLKHQTLSHIERLIDVNPAYKNKLIQNICKSDYERAKPHLMELLKTDLLSVFSFIYWYAKDRAKEWLKVIEAHIFRIEDEETFRFFTYLLKETNTNYGSLITPFASHPIDEIRLQSLYTLGQLKNKKDYIEIFIEGLRDPSNRVIHASLQALSGLKDKRLLASYKELAEKFPIEQDYILANLNHRLADYGLTNKTILNHF